MVDHLKPFQFSLPHEEGCKAGVAAAIFRRQRNTIFDVDPFEASRSILHKLSGRWQGINAVCQSCHNHSLIPNVEALISVSWGPQDFENLHTPLFLLSPLPFSSLPPSLPLYMPPYSCSVEA